LSDNSSNSISESSKKVQMNKVNNKKTNYKGICYLNNNIIIINFFK